MAKLYIRARNKGQADASNVQIKLFYAMEDATSWSPVRSVPDSGPNDPGQVLLLASVAANSETVGSVDWCLPTLPVGNKNKYRRIKEVTRTYKLKAEIISGDSSMDNNVACRTGVLVHEKVGFYLKPNERTKPQKPRHPKENKKHGPGKPARTHR
jgi:hypothetical protein